MRSLILTRSTLTWLLLTSCGEDDLVVPDGPANPEPELDARVVLRDASGTGRDAGMDASDSSAHDAAAQDAAPDSAVCDGATPHGCFVARADNPTACPPNVYEQSAGYPPTEEWKGCDTDWYVPCVYSHPPADDITCVCDLGIHWICSY